MLVIGIPICVKAATNYISFEVLSIHVGANTMPVFSTKTALDLKALYVLEAKSIQMM